MHAFLFYFSLLSSLSIAISFAEPSKKLSGFTIDLIHSDSPLSPFYNPSLTPSERIRRAVMSSMARSNRLRLSRNQNGSPKTVTISDPFGGYLMKFYIGTPPVERFALADTGSDLIWVQCTPCMKCIPQNRPLFDPTKSKTYRRVRCDSQPCTLFPQTQRRCGKSGECVYKYGYGDSSFNYGILGVEKISFGNKNGVEFPKFTFGCAYYNEDTDKNKMNNGLVGLGVGPLSLISQLGDRIGRKFSLCFLPLDSNLTSKMKFGDDAMIKEGTKGVVFTTLILRSSAPSFYYLNLEGISIGNKKVNISRGPTDGNMLIDSGTTHVTLEQGIFNEFVALVEELFGVVAVKNPPASYHFCFKDNVGTPTPNYHEVVFHFTGAKVSVDFEQLFVMEEENLICSMIDPTDDKDGSIFGNQATVGYQVLYDLEGGTISFAPADCAK